MWRYVRWSSICVLALLLIVGSKGNIDAGAFVTTITVNTSEDVNNSLGTTCSSATDGKCTLRRAIIEASNLAPGARPALIGFNIPNTDANFQREAPDTWTVVVDKGALPPLKTQSITNKTGRVTIDGATQPGGRSTGPKVFIDLGDSSLEIESEENVIKNLGFIVMGSILVKENGNRIEDNWMGLTGDGQSLKLRTPNDEKRLAIGGGVTMRSDNNTVQRNTIAGAFARAVDIDGGSNNTVSENNIGTRADGTVPAVPEQSICVASFNFDPQNWYGGWGISLSGSNNKILSNRIVGMQNLRAENDTAPMALEIFGSDHVVEKNQIGIDADDDEGSPTGVCGQGVKVSGSGTNILDNVVTASRAGFESNQGGTLDAAILYSDNRFSPGGITVRRNIVREGPGNIYLFGPEIVSALRNFRPARITEIDSTTVSGANGVDKDGNQSQCPNCIIDFYLDGTNLKADALEYLGSTTADGDGNFTFNLAVPLSQNTGIRTSSTSTSANIIGSLAMSTTTQFSGLYMKEATLAIEGPETGNENESYTFTFRFLPASLAGPVTYTIQVTDFQEQVSSLEATAAQLPIKWAKAGVKTITVTASNGLVSATSSHQIQIGDVVSGGLYLPVIIRR